MLILTKRRRLVVLLAVLSVFALVLVGRWLNATKIGGQQPAEPFRIAGNFYYVGASDVAAFLITGPEGHVVLDGGYPTTARLIMASIAKLGFDIKDVKVLLNSEPHPDHGGGLTVLQQASGAQLWASDASADSLASGGDDPDVILPLRALTWIGVLGYSHRVSTTGSGTANDSCRADCAHRAHHSRAHPRLHLVVVPRSRR
jgi:metallo-beta-lactamase class B